MNPSEEKNGSGGLFAFFLNRPKLSFLITFFLLLFGMMQVFAIPKESTPHIEYGLVVVTTVYPGASALDVDELVTQEIEDKIEDVSNIKSISSSSQEGVSQIQIEFETGADMTKAMGDLRSKVDAARPFLPEEVDDDPVLIEVDSSIRPFLFLILSGDESPAVLRDWGETLKQKLEIVSGISDVKINGGKEWEISVLVSQEKLDNFGLSLSQVTSALQKTHQDLPLGDITLSGREYSMRFSGKHKTREDIESVVIKRREGGGHFSLVTVGDIAEVLLQEKDDDTIFSFRTQGEERKNAVSLQLLRKGEGDIFAIHKAVNTVVQKFSQNTLPASLHITPTQDLLVVMKDDYQDVLLSGFQSFVIVMIFLFLFVGVTEGIVASFVIPLTFLGTISVLALMGKTLNVMTNFSMILSLGILVDVAIVVVEGIHQGIRKGLHPRDAALTSLQEFSKPLLAGVLTTLAVFIPLLSLPDLLGQFLSFIPVTVSLVLIISLLISFYLLPTFAATIFQKKQKGREKKKDCTLCKQFRISFDGKIEKVRSSYAKILRAFLENNIVGYVAMGALVLLFFLSFRLPIPFELFPSGDAPNMSIGIEVPVGSDPQQVEELAAKAEEIFFSFPETQSITTDIIGEKAELSVEFLPVQERKDRGMKTALELEFLFLKALSPLETSQNFFQIRRQKKGPPSESPVAFRILPASRENIEEAQKLTEDLTEIMRSLPGTSGVKNNIEKTAGEFHFQLREQEVVKMGIDPGSVPFAIRTAINGTTALKISRNLGDIDVVVQLKDEDISSIEDIKNLPFFLPNGQRILLGQIIDIKETDGLKSINRREGSIAFTISSFLDDGGNAAEIENLFLQKVEEENLLPDSVSLVNGGENSENAALIGALLRGFIVALLLIFFILVIIFNSYTQPFLILSTILFAQIGVAFGLLATGTPRSLSYILGVIALAGVVVNDAIILVDRINNQKKKYPTRSYIDILVASGKSRFLPIILTTLTTSAGILPLVFIDAFWRGLGFTVIFGLLMASFLTLFLTPLFSLRFEQKPLKTSGFFVGMIFVSVGVFLLLG